MKTTCVSNSGFTEKENVEYIYFNENTCNIIVFILYIQIYNGIRFILFRNKDASSLYGNMSELEDIGKTARDENHKHCTVSLTCGIRT